MKLVSFKIKNFRGYSKETIIDINNLTVLVGKNDVGKSTVLEALDIFFNNGQGAVKIDKDDVNIIESAAGSDETVFTACFEDLPNSIVIDSTVETTLEDEFLLNDKRQLEIIKKYKNGASPKTYIRALHPTNSKCDGLLLLKNANLKKIVKDEGIECEDMTSNVALRKAIWNNYKDDLKLEICEIDAAKEEAKKIWGGLDKCLPIFSLFQADRRNSDGDDEVQDPLKEAVKHILSDTTIQDMLKEISEQVQKELQDVADRTLEKLKEIDPSVADGLHPVIPSYETLKWHDVFKNVSISGDGDIPINKRGSGVKRLVLLSFFRAEAEKDRNDDVDVIYAIEEPETSQHADNQRMLIAAFKKLALKNKSQVILTTHSPHIVKELEFEDIRLIKNNKDGSKSITEIEPKQLKYPSLNEVNYIAFDEVTEEYHDELYSVLVENEWLNDFKKGKEQRDYVKVFENNKIRNYKKTLPEYIRDMMHHPENKKNVKYTQEELKKSIELMREYLGSRDK